VKAILILLALLGLAVGARSSAQTGDVDDFRTLTVLQVDPAANEIRVRESGTLRVRTLQLDENSVISGGGGTGGSMTLREIQAGDQIRVRDLASSASDRVHADRIQVLATPPDRPATGGTRVDPSDRTVRTPNALEAPVGEPDALEPPRPGDPSALDPPRPGDPSALEPSRPRDPSALAPDEGLTGPGNQSGTSGDRGSSTGKRGSSRSGAGGSSGGSSGGGSGSGGGP
jgi:hypothetical protein